MNDIVQCTLVYTLPDKASRAIGPMSETEAFRLRAFMFDHAGEGGVSIEIFEHDPTPVFLGQVIGRPFPEEPPVGTILKARDDHGVFSLVRTEKGWHQSGRPRAYTWRSVVREWLPATVVRAPK